MTKKEELPLVDPDDPEENEDWILTPEKRKREVALFDGLPEKKTYKITWQEEKQPKEE